MVFDRSKLPSSLGGSSNEDKTENFERSTLKLVLGQLGKTAGEIRGLEADLGTGFGWDWFNQEGLVRGRIGSAREFRFNFFELLTKPTGHPIVEAFADFKGASLDPCCLVFHVYDHGRWVATNLTTTDETSIHIVAVRGTLKFNVLPFAKFFATRWGPT